MISMILAMNLNGTIGDKGWLTWDAPNDMKWFRDYTKGKTLVCGRKTFESLPTKYIVEHDIITLSRNWYETHHLTVGDILELSKDVMIIGGGEIYKQFLPYADKLYLSIIPQVYYGDTTFEICWNEWDVVYTEGNDDALCMILERIKGE